MMSLKAYNGLEETLHLLQSNENRQRLEKSVENISAKRDLMQQNLVEE